MLPAWRVGHLPSRVVAKLDVRDRAQAVIAAYDAGLVKPASQSAPDQRGEGAN